MVNKSKIEEEINALIKLISNETQEIYQASRSEVNHDAIIEAYGRANQNNKTIDRLEELKRKLIYM